MTSVLGVSSVEEPPPPVRQNFFVYATMCHGIPILAHVRLFFAVTFLWLTHHLLTYKSRGFYSTCGRFVKASWFQGFSQIGSVRFGSVRFGSVRFGSVRFGSVRFGGNLLYLSRPFNLTFPCLFNIFSAHVFRCATRNAWLQAGIEERSRGVDAIADGTPAEAHGGKQKRLCQGRL